MTHNTTKLGGIIDVRCKGCSKAKTIPVKKIGYPAHNWTETRCAVYSNPSIHWDNHDPDRAVPYLRAGCPFHPSVVESFNRTAGRKRRVGQQKQKKGI